VTRRLERAAMMRFTRLVCVYMSTFYLKCWQPRGERAARGRAASARPRARVSTSYLRFLNR